MINKPDIKLIHIRCKRCKRTITTTSRSLLGADRLKQRLGGICEDCVTPDERAEILAALGAAITSQPCILTEPTKNPEQ